MNCSEVERILPDVLDTSTGTSHDTSDVTSAETAPGFSSGSWVGSSANDVEVQAHLKSCPACAALVADLRLIANEAAALAETEEPPERVWVKISNQLRAEGLIHDSEAADHRHPAGPVLVPSFAPRRRALWWMAPVAAAILAAGSYQLLHHSGSNNPQVAQLQTPASSAQSAPSEPSSQSPASQSSEQAAPATNHAVATAQSASPSRPASATQAPDRFQNRVQDNDDQLAQNQIGQPIISPSNADDQRFLSEVSSRAPSMRSTYQNQLRAVNNEILETQSYIQQHPNDLDARQHLLDVFQQKSLLYQMALDRIQ